MHQNPGKACFSPFRVFFVLLVAIALGARGALAQSTVKPGPMQSGGHTAQEAATPSQMLDVGKLFATTCGWCHSGGGREAGKGPRLMGTELTDEQLISRIRDGKTGQMPAFGGAFADDQIRAIVAYIRNLTPEPAVPKK